MVGKISFLFLFYVRYYSLSVANNVIYLNRSQLTGTIFLVRCLWWSLIDSISESFTVTNPGENTRQGPFLHSFEGIWKVRGGNWGRHNLMTIWCMHNSMPLDLWVESAHALTELENTVWEMLSSKVLLCDRTKSRYAFVNVNPKRLCFVNWFVR